MYCVLAELFYNKQFVQQLQRTPGMTWKAGIPKKFENYTREQVRAMLNGVVSGPETMLQTKYVKATPDSWDWATERPECSGRDTIRDQGACGSCWAFSAVNQYADNRCINKLDNGRVQYSEQYVVSCDPKDMGCNGGWLDKVQSYLVSTGTSLDKCNPYTSGKFGITGKCPTQCDDGSAIVLTHATKTEAIAKSDEEAIKSALTIGTVQVAFTVYSDFMNYVSGIYQHKSGYIEGGHAVLFVGYGAEDDVPFWKVKNSWGNDWGEDGYFRIIRGQDECGIEDDTHLLTP